MFTGIIQAVGKIAAMEQRGGDVRLYVKTGVLDLGDVALGDSIATNGVCLTVIELPGDGFWADVSRESIERTSFRFAKTGVAVNLEKSLTPETRMGGHLVTGHVDGIGEVVNRHDDARSVKFTIRAPSQLAKYIAEKGSICIDGTSLTVNAVSGANFDINIIPHTVKETVIGGYQVGTQVNLEVDLIARYLERLLLGERAADPNAGTGLDLAKLRDNGFA
ncbi:MAG: riboflavin synthase [Pseudomonadales bacterium]|nr:riboflavin synthase [Pseudomonadales bacterium]MCP5213729.1 riboflavin synthase [Pseudomonadales bacterium]